jgi:hypothetical protein
LIFISQNVIHTPANVRNFPGKDYIHKPAKELSGNKRHKFTGDGFCSTKTENVRIPGYVIIFKMQYCEKQTRKCTVYFLTVPKSFFEVPEKNRPLCGKIKSDRLKYTRKFVGYSFPGKE